MFIRGISMKKLLEVLRLHFNNNLSVRQIAITSAVSKSTVSNYLALFNKSGLSWPLDPEYLNETKLSAMLNPGAQVNNKDSKIDFISIHNELKQHKKLTLQLLWEEYNQRGEMPYSYGHLALLYRKWLSKKPEYMRQTHKAGEKIFVDYSGDIVPIYDKFTGEIKEKAQIFVGVLGASNYIYIEATHSQKLCDWTMSHVRMFEHINGVPELVILDNLKSGVSKPHRYDPDITPAYYHMLAHYKTVAMPARIYTPKDKAKAENGVLIIQRWIIARLRNMKFTSLEELNTELSKLMLIANNKFMKLYQCSRLDLFNKLDKPVLRALPEFSYVYQDYKKVRVGGDYHINVENHFYSVPYNLIKSEVDVWYTSNKIEVYHKNICVAKHVRSYQLGGKTSDIEHMPVDHKKFEEMNSTKIKEIAIEIGVATKLIIDHIINDSPHESIACRKSYGFLKLAKKYGKTKLENACNYAISIGVFNYKNIEILLASNIIKDDGVIHYHSNIRGSKYYS